MRGISSNQLKLLILGAIVAFPVAKFLEAIWHALWAKDWLSFLTLLSDPLFQVGIAQVLVPIILLIIFFSRYQCCLASADPVTKIAFAGMTIGFLLVLSLNLGRPEYAQLIVRMRSDFIQTFAPIFGAFLYVSISILETLRTGDGAPRREKFESARKAS